MATSLTSNTLTLGSRIIRDTIPEYTLGTHAATQNRNVTGTVGDIGSIHYFSPFMSNQSSNTIWTNYVYFPSGTYVGFYCNYVYTSNDYPRCTYNGSCGATFPVVCKGYTNSRDGGGGIFIRVS